MGRRKGPPSSHGRDEGACIIAFLAPFIDTLALSVSTPLGYTVPETPWARRRLGVRRRRQRGRGKGGGGHREAVLLHVGPDPARAQRLLRPRRVHVPHLPPAEIWPRFRCGAAGASPAADGLVCRAPATHRYSRPVGVLGTRSARRRARRLSAQTLACASLRRAN